MEKVTLKASNRKILGRKVKTLRSKGILPGNVYGKKIKSFSIELSSKEFSKIFDKVGETGLIELQINSRKTPVLVTNVHLDPVSEQFLHVDFRQVDLKEKVTATVPLELVGESGAQKSGLGTVVQQLSEVEVEALPVDLPERFDVDISSLSEVDQAILIKELNYDRSKVEVKEDPEQIIVKVEPPQKEEEVLVPPPAPEAEAVEAETPTEEPKPEEAKPQEASTPQT